MITLLCSETKNETDQAFMIHIYKTHARMIHAIICKMVSNQKDQEDVLQECLVRMIPKVDLLRTLSPSRLAGYAATVARNTSLSFLRLQKNERELLSFQEVEILPSSMPSLEETLLKTEDLDALYQVWPLLSDDDQAILSGRYILQYTDQELSDYLGCPKGGVRMRLSRARKRAYALIKKQGEGH